MKCANCDKEAMFEYRMTQEKSVLYCGKDLPSFLNERKKAGLLKITEGYKSAAESAIEAITMEVPEVLEEPVTPKKKATTKKSAK